MLYFSVISCCQGGRNVWMSEEWEEMFRSSSKIYSRYSVPKKYLNEVWGKAKWKWMGNWCLDWYTQIHCLSWRRLKLNLHEEGERRKATKCRFKNVLTGNFVLIMCDNCSHDCSLWNEGFECYRCGSKCFFPLSFPIHMVGIFLWILFCKLKPWHYFKKILGLKSRRVNAEWAFRFNVVVQISMFYRVLTITEQL